MPGLKKLIERIKSRVETVTRDKGPAPLFSIETVLLVLSVVYGGLMSLRAHLYKIGVFPSKHLPCRVVSIGNVIAGGTGKTPMTIMVARMIRDMGYRVVVISRGYRGRMEDKGGIVSDGKTVFKGPEDAGDEPYLMAKILKGVPVVVGRRRYEAGLRAVEQFQPDVIVLDDAFQHLRLGRDLNLVLMDSHTPFGNGHILPRGLLREPASALRRAHAVIFTRSNRADTPSALTAPRESLPIFHTAHIPVIRKTGQGSGTFLADTTDLSILRGKKAVAFGGLANNDQFFDSLKRAGCLLEHTFSFADHYRYVRNDIDRIARTAQEKGAEVIVTTFKDNVKIQNCNRWPVDLLVVVVISKITKPEDNFLSFLLDALHLPDTRTPEGFGR